MKFRIKVDGKDSISEGIAKAAAEKLRADGIEFSHKEEVAWADAYDKKVCELQSLVGKFLRDGEGGNDSVTVEFDTKSGTCKVVPIKKLKD